MKLFVREEGEGGYRPATPDEIFTGAKRALSRRYRRGVVLESPKATRELCRLKLANLPHEVFCIIWLDNRHRIIAFEELFRGTIDGTSVYPREVVKAGLAHNAAACVLTHCHPSGVAEPSQADEMISTLR